MLRSDAPRVACPDVVQRWVLYWWPPTDLRGVACLVCQLLGPFFSPARVRSDVLDQIRCEPQICQVSALQHFRVQVESWSYTPSVQ